MQNAIVTGSISDITKTSGKSFALTFLDVEIVVIVDTSGSMSDRDSRGGKSRYEVACDELANLQADNPGKILVISFSNSAQVCLGGVPYYEGGSTDLRNALQYAKQYDMPDMKFFVISDGYPDDPESAIAVAKQYQGLIHTIFVGPETDRTGREFLARLANAKGGKTVLAENAKKLAASVNQLLLKA